MATPIEVANAGVTVVQAPDLEEVRRRGGIMISDAIALHMYKLEKQVFDKYQSVTTARREGRDEASQEILKYKSKAREYKKLLRRLNDKHRLTVLELKELKRKYDAVMRAADVQKEDLFLDDIPF